MADQLAQGAWQGDFNGGGTEALEQGAWQATAAAASSSSSSSSSSCSSSSCSSSSESVSSSSSSSSSSSESVSSSSSSCSSSSSSCSQSSSSCSSSSTSQSSSSSSSSQATECVKTLITQNLKDRLETLTTYPGGATPTVELERLVLRIGKRYPYIMICGPWSEAEDEITLNTNDKLTYIIKYYVNKGDENTTENTELPYLTRNVAADIVKHIMNDVSRGQRAQKTEKISNGYAYDLSNIGVWEFYVYVIIEVQVFINKLDPYLIG